VKRPGPALGFNGYLLYFPLMLVMALYPALVKYLDNLFIKSIDLAILMS